MHQVQQNNFQCGRCFAVNQFVRRYQGSVLCADCHWHMQQMKVGQIEQSDLSRIDFGLPMVTEKSLWHNKNQQSSATAAWYFDSADVISASHHKGPSIEPVEYTIFDKDNRTALTGCLEIEIPSNRRYDTCAMMADTDSCAFYLSKNTLPSWLCSSRVFDTWTPLQNSFPGFFNLIHSSC
ncbi:hypothetical protein XU18_1099 [Perkinsela sp. CCAP 1560/4]|nr:hypothetical protein XU18_1099 [Perkinsela sp. CCAP 1560/4]|eukprot:KNH08386.1 hypothetical protein XU18_1099 [Perkinsela sp. CCAP 1560/4]